MNKIYGTLEQWVQLRQFLLKNKPDFLVNMYSEPRGGEGLLSNFTPEQDMWLLQNCPLDFVREALKQQYRIETKKIMNKLQALKDAGLIGCLNDSGVTSKNYKEILYERNKRMPCMCWYDPPEESKKLIKSLCQQLVDEVRRLERYGDPSGCTIQDVKQLIDHLSDRSVCKEKPKE